MSAQKIPSPIYIGVFGGPRVGKSSFIREVITRNHTRLNLPPTNDVRLMKPMTIDGRQVVFVDTPAFYNRALRNMDSADVLKRLAGFLTRLQQNGRMLHAAIFIHPKASRQNAPWLVEDANRNWPIFCQLVGESFFPNVIFATTSWSNPPTQEQTSQETQLRSQEPFRSQVQRVNWASGPSPQGALDITRLAMRRSPRQVAIQRDILDRRLHLADTGAGRAVVANSKQMAQQLKARGNAQGAQMAGGIEGRLRQGFEREANRWPIKQSRPPKPAASGAKPRPKPTPRPTPAAQRPGQRQSGPISRPNSHASANNRVRQYGPIGTPPMAHQPGRVSSNIQMQQVQPTPQPGMRIQPTQNTPPVHHHHHHTTHVHTPPNHHAPSPRASIVQNNSSYYNYSYEQRNNTTNTSVQNTSSAYGGLAAGAGLVGGVALGYVAYEALDDDNNSIDENEWDQDDLYIDDDSIAPDDSSEYMDDDDSNTYDDNLDSYDNNPTSYADNSGNQWNDPMANADPAPADNYIDSNNYSRDNSGGGVVDSSGGGDDSGDGDGCCDDCCDCGNCCECNNCCECDNCCDFNCCGGDDDDDGCCC